MVSLRDQTILALRQQVAELVKERDEARAEVEAGDRRWSLAVDECDRLRAERDRLRALLRDGLALLKESIGIGGDPCSQPCAHADCAWQRNVTAELGKR